MGRDGEVDGATLTPENLADLLATASWRSVPEINSMSDDNKRNTIIVELNNRTNESISALQGRDDATLIAAGALLLNIEWNGWRSWNQMRSMSIDDLRNTCIVELANKGYGSISELQGLWNRDLVHKAANYYRKTRRGQRVEKMTLHFDLADIPQLQPRCVASKDFDNSGSDSKLYHSFSFSEENTEENWITYSKESYWSLCSKIGVTYEVTAPFYKVGVSGSIEASGGQKQNWGTTHKSVTKQSYKEETRVEVPPRSRLRVELIVYMSNISIPFTMEVITQTGERKTVTGTYHDVRGFKSYVKQTTM